MKEAEVRGRILPLARRCQWIGAVSWGLRPLYLQLGPHLRRFSLAFWASRVLPEGLLQCRTQKWNRSAPNNTRETDTRERRGKGGKEGGKETGKMWGGGCAQITSHHCYSPAQGQQQREACCPTSCTVSASRFLSPRREKDGGINGCIPTYTQQSGEKKVQNVPQL